jgi:geranylgeranylglycerol-phosphate geranylgeranyltransferase
MVERDGGFMTGRRSALRFLSRSARFATDLMILSRPVAALCAGAQLLVGANLTRPESQPAIRFGVLLREGIAISLVTATVMVVNDIRDIGADAVSRPNRPLPAGRLSTSAAWRLACVEGSAGLVLSADVPLGFAVTLALLVIGVAYSYALKGTVLWGNLVVAFLASTPILYGARLGGVQPLPALIVAMMIFVFMFAFEVLKTIRDVAADRSAGYQTVATKWGARAAAAIFRTSLTAYALLSFSPIFLDGVSAYYFAIMSLGVVVPSSIAGWHFAVDRSATAVRTVLHVMAISWIPGLVALAVAFRG